MREYGPSRVPGDNGIIDSFYITGLLQLRINGQEKLT
jgi:hypothetical protein